MTRGVFIEMVVRAVYGDFPPNDRTITDNLVNTWIEPGIGLAVKQAYKDSINFDGVSYVNNSFSTQFKGITLTQDSDFIWKGTLPVIPMGLGKTDGINVLRLAFADGKISDPLIPLSEQQTGYASRMRPIPNKSLYWPEGKDFYIMTVVQLNGATAKVSMVSGGDPTNFNSELNAPNDYIPIVLDYCVRNLTRERMTPKDTTNDKRDN